jgi:ankyrin repeat protein
VHLLLAKAEVSVDAGVAGGLTPLMSAAQRGMHEILQLLLARPGISINAENDVGTTALLLASSYGHPTPRAWSFFWATRTSRRLGATTRG